MKAFIGSVLGTLAVALLAIGGNEPTVSGARFTVRLRPASKADNEVVPAGQELTETFRGGQRACVILEGDHDPDVRLGLVIFDQNRQIVAQDDNGTDFAAAIWYPPRDGAYTIQIKNYGTDYKPGLEYTDVRVAVR